MVELIEEGDKHCLYLSAKLGNGTSWRSKKGIRSRGADDGAARRPRLQQLCEEYDWPLADGAEAMEAAFDAFSGRKSLPNPGRILPGGCVAEGKKHPALQAGQCWNGTLDLTELKNKGCVLMPGFLPKGGRLVTGLHAVATDRSISGVQPKVHSGLGSSRQAVASQVVPIGTALGNEDRGKVRPATQDEAALHADLAVEFRKQVGLDDAHTTEYMTGEPPTDRGFVHGDNASPSPSVASVIILNPEGGVGPFFVGADAKTPGLGYSEAKMARWERADSGTATMVGLNEASWDPQFVVTPAGRRSRELVPRPMLNQGDAVFFDSTSPHAGPGTMAGEPTRVVMYLGFHSAKVELHTVVLSALHAAHAGSAGAVPTVPAFDEAGYTYARKVKEPRVAKGKAPMAAPQSPPPSCTMR